MKRKLIARHARKMATAVCGMFMVASALQSCEDELLTGQPDWLGNSIYERLQNDTEGQSYSTLLRLINDLGEAETLSHTGSRTIFAADDAAFQRWFATNKWGVRSYEELSNAQKKLLLRSATVTNAYLIELLSNASGNPPTKGASMRRTTAVSIYDSVPLLTPQQLPDAPGWQALREKGENVLLFKDATARPILHLLPEFMRVNGFTGDDIRMLTNGRSSSVDSSWINGVRVTRENITCKNGYIHKVAEVIEPVDNMAEILHNHPQLSLWSRLLDRYSAPYYLNNESKEYSRLNGTEGDSVYTVNYFSNRSRGGDTLKVYPDNRTNADALLLFDPGWNQYMYSNPQNHDLHYDAAAMLAPTNEALEDWWQNRGGAALRSQFHEWDSIPNDILADLLNNNLLDAFINTIPSKFASIVDDSQVRMGVTMNDVDSCFMGCNGVVYSTNRVFAPSSFTSVVFPAQIHQQTMNIIYWAIDQLGFKPFLNSMETTYSLFIPTNTAMLTYLDPTTYGSLYPTLYEFYYDDDKTTPTDQRVKARRYQLSLQNGKLKREEFPTFSSETNRSIIRNRLEDLLNSLIIVGELKPGQEYYKTRGGSVVRVLNPNTASMTVAGGYQLEDNPVVELYDGSVLEMEKPLPIGEQFDQTSATNGIGNGMSYELNTALPLSSTNSLSTLLAQTPEFSEFYDLVGISDLEFFETEQELGSNRSAYPNYGSQNFSLFDGYTYTVYVPSNDVIRDLQERGYLPKADDLTTASLRQWGSTANQNIAKEVILSRLNNFVRYHVHDNSVFIAGDPVQQTSYESSKVNPANNRFYSINVTANSSSLSVNGLVAMDDSGQPHAAMTDNGEPIAAYSLKVDTESGIYNKMIREFWNQGSARTESDSEKTIYASSNGVVHLLKGGALFFDASQLTKWEDEVNAKIASATRNR